MGYISKKDREKIPREDFGLPETMLYPIRDQQDLDDAEHLVGKHPEAKARIIAIAKRKKLRLPQTWLGDNAEQPVLTHARGIPDGLAGRSRAHQKQGAKMTALFSIAPEGRAVVGDYAVYPNRLVFRAGDYPDHGLTLSPEEMAAAVERAEGREFAGNIEHTEFLAGNACFVGALKIDETDPWILRGDVKIPLWLDEGLGNREKKVSTEWHTGTKDFLGLALCVHPAIPEADLLATFAKHKQKTSSPHASRTFQAIHDMAANTGAYCVDPEGDTANRNASFIMRHERGGMQKIHDHAVEHGASCPGGSSYFSLPTPASQKGKPMSLLAKLTRIFGSAPAQDALTDEEVQAVFTRIVDPATKPAEKAPAPPSEPPPVADFTKNAEFVALKEQAATFARQNAEFKARILQGDAEQWADAEIKEHERALPGERPAMIAAFIQASLDDEAPEAVARFSEPAKALAGNRLEMLKALFAGRRRHVLYQEFLQNPGAEGAETTVFTVPSVKSVGPHAKPDPKDVEELRRYSTILGNAKAKQSA